MGIPHIYAKTDADMMFALGYVHAQDRLYQMEFQRRVATGQLAALWGPGPIADHEKDNPKAIPALIATDKFIRTLGFAQGAQQTWDSPTTLTPTARGDLSAYASGVNAFLGEGRALPPEFLISGLMMGGGELLGPWEETHSLAWLKAMSLDLGSNFRRELGRLYMAGLVDEARITDFYTPYPGMERFELPDLNSLYAMAGPGGIGQTASIASPAGMADWPAPAATVGSNNWVIDGALMDSGASMLANDPHLGLGVPAVWYFAHISSQESGINAIGATLPGVPAIIIGRNNDIAWGFTNTGPDVQDFFVERISKQTGLYETPNGWQPIEERVEVIKVARGEDVEFTVRSTRHGPLMSDILSVPVVFADDDVHEYGFALQWPTIMASVPDTSMNAASAAFRAHDYAGFRDAMQAYVAPQQNMVVLENGTGNIGYIAPGKVPVRKAENAIQGWAPSPGWDSAYDWDGFIAFEALPQTYNPASGYVITANADIRPPDYGPYITRDWSLPLRQDRIEALTIGLSADQDRLLTMADMETAIADQRVNSAAMALPAMLAATDLSSLSSADQQTAQAMMAALQTWGDADYPGAGGEIGPSLFFAWYRDFVFGATFDDLKIENTTEYSAPSITSSFFRFNPQLALHLADGTAAGWCDCGVLLAETLITAHEKLTQELGGNMDKWQWAKLHEARSKHAVLGTLPAMITKPLTGLSFRIDRDHGGGPYSVNVSGFKFRDSLDFNANHTASLRFLIEAGRFEQARFVHTQGQSGHPMSPHFDDMADLWEANKFAPMATDRKRFKAAHTLTLTPAN